MTLRGRLRMAMYRENQKKNMVMMCGVNQIRGRGCGFSHARRKAQRLVSETGLESGPGKMERVALTERL